MATLHENLALRIRGTAAAAARAHIVCQELVNVNVLIKMKVIVTHTSIAHCALIRILPFTVLPS